MLATDNLDFESIDEKNHTNVNAPPKRKKKHDKKKHHMEKLNGVMEHDNNSLTDSMPSRLSKNSENKKFNDLSLETSTNLSLKDQNSNTNSHHLDNTLNLVENSKTFQQIDLNTITDDDDNDINERGKRKNLSPTNHIINDHDPMVSSLTTGGGDDDTIEIYEFNANDVDAYLDIYFDALDNRLKHFIGNNDELQEFRLKTKNRIISNTNSPEYQNVLLGKMNGEIVAAITLVFPGETTTILNENMIPQEHSCLVSLRRWMLRNANYIPNEMEECYIEMIGVKSAHRKNGIGAAMLDCAEHYARQAGANFLTIHVSGEQLKNYFERFGFGIDHSDNSSFWKWIVERESINKMTKDISSNYDNDAYTTDVNSGHITESITESEHQ